MSFVTPGRSGLGVTLLSLWVLGPANRALGQPLPIGTSTVTVSYETTAGVVSFSGERDYQADASGPGDATVLGDAPNIRAFNSINSFGRRMFLATSNPNFAHVMHDDETLIAHAFFKNVPADVGEDFFPDLVPGGSITVTIGPIQFAEPVRVDHTTMMVHALWNGNQADLLPLPYINLHNHHTESVDFRDLDDFLAGGVFSDFPVPNYSLGDISPQVTGEGTTTLSFSVTFPYAILKNLEEAGQTVPPNLPAPQGFLEPFHFHIEYTVSPAPVVGVPASSTASAGLLAAIVLGSTLVALRRRRMIAA